MESIENEEGGRYVKKWGFIYTLGDGRVPVGAVFYGGEASGGLHELFG
jgi:hypothetical protein